MKRYLKRVVILALLALGTALIILPALANNDDYNINSGASVSGAPINPPPTQSQKGSGVQTAVATLIPPTSVPATNTPVPPTPVPPTNTPVPPTPVPPTLTPEPIDPPQNNTPEPSEPPLTYTPVGA